MAGGFGGDDKDFDHDDEQEDLEEQFEIEQQEEKRRIELEKKVLRGKLNRLSQNIQKKQLPFLNPFEKKTLNQAKQYPEFKPQILQINGVMAAKKAQFASKVMSAIGPAIPYILIGALILFLIIVIVAYIGQMMPWLFPGEDASNGATSVFGASGKDFYGVRTIYKDDEQSRANLLENYAGTITNVLGEITSITSVSNVANSTLEITILSSSNAGAIALPGEDFDYSSFDENEFKVAYPDLWNLTNGVVEIAWKVDNNSETVPAELTLNEKLDGIKYFGFNETINAGIKTLVEDYVKAHYSFETSGEIAQSDVELEMDNKLTSYFAQNNLKIRTQKLFIKDFIFNSEDDRMSGIQKKNYVQAIFMPKANVYVDYFSVYISYIDEANFDIKLMNGSNEIALTKDDGITEGEVTNYTYTSNDNLNIQPSEFTYFDAQNKDKLTTEKSFYDLLFVEGLDYSKYLVETIVENDNSILTWQRGDLFYAFESEQPFMFVEGETMSQTS